MSWHEENIIIKQGCHLGILNTGVFPYLLIYNNMLQGC